MKRHIAVCVTFFTLTGWFTSIPSRPCQAGPTVLETPSGLTVGEQFQFVFVTSSKTDATSTDISTYNSFVNTDAAGATYGGSVVTWSALGSTQAVNAISQSGEAANAVFLVDGTEVASSTLTSAGGLWSGSLMNPIDETVTGSVVGSEVVFTGTMTNGDQVAGSQLGMSSVTTGSTDKMNSHWVDATTNTGSGKHYLYAISEVLTVEGSVPEPSTLVGLSTCMAIALAAVGLRRRKAQRRAEAARRENGDLDPIVR